MGLLDNITEDQILGGLLGAGAASGAKGNFLSRLAAGMGAGEKFSQGREEQKRQRSQEEMQAEFRKLQMIKAQREEQQAAAQQAQQGIDKTALSGAFSTSPIDALRGGGGPTMANAANIGQEKPFDVRQFMASNPNVSGDAIKQYASMNDLINPKPKAPISVAAGATLLDPTTMKPVFQNPKEDSVPSAIKEYQFAKDQGYGGTYQQWTMENNRSRAVNVNNSVSVAGPENKYNQVVGEGLAKDSLTTVEIAQAAPGVVENAQMIRSAINGGAITGTGAVARYTLQKALETAGVVGPGKAANTQALMAGLGKLTLSGIKTSGLGGGNGFTDKDRAFLQSAVSGEIDSTPENLLRVADMSERIARANHKKGADITSRWKGNPALGPVVQDTQITPLPEEQKPRNNQVQAGVAPPSAAVNMLKMNPKLRDQFDAKYGAGAAAQILGK